MGEPTAGMMVTSSIQLVRPLGAGGMGRVWVAQHLGLKTQVVVKFLAAELASDPDSVARFSREAAAASQVKSPHVVQMLDHGVSADGDPFIAMELLEGQDLSTYLAIRGRLAPAETVDIVLQMARALAKAHARGIIHRDVKPENTFLCGEDGDRFVKVLDFGIARATAASELGPSTRTGSMIGTPFYMSPEQIAGAKDLDARADVWSLGVVAYQLLTGRVPFQADTIGGLAIAIHSGDRPKPTALVPALPGGIDAWFARACAHDLAARFQSAKELAAALAVVCGVAVPSDFSVSRSKSADDSSSFQVRIDHREGAELARTEAAPRAESTSPSTSRVPGPPQPRRRARGAWVIVVGLALFALAAGVFLLRRTPLVAPSAPAAASASAAPASTALASPTPAGSGPSANSVLQSASASSPPAEPHAKHEPPIPVNATSASKTTAKPLPSVSSKSKPAQPSTFEDVQ